jgi:hypothetical protein
MSDVYIVRSFPLYDGGCAGCGERKPVADRLVVTTSGKNLFNGPLCDDCARRWTDSRDCAEHFSATRPPRGVETPTV